MRKDTWQCLSAINYKPDRRIWPIGLSKELSVFVHYIDVKFCKMLQEIR